MSRRSSAEVDGGRCGWVQCPTMRRRCQRNSVSGVTSHPARLGRGSAAAIAPSKVRSASVSSGRSTCRRSTPSWWRNTMISRSFERRERTARRTSATKKRYIMRCTRSASARIAAGQRPRPSFRHPHLRESQRGSNCPSDTLRRPHQRIPKTRMTGHDRVSGAHTCVKWLARRWRRRPGLAQLDGSADAVGLARGEFFVDLRSVGSQHDRRDQRPHRHRAETPGVRHGRSCHRGEHCCLLRVAEASRRAGDREQHLLHF